MKKRMALISALVLAVLLSACSAGKAQISIRSSWTENAEILSAVELSNGSLLFKEAASEEAPDPPLNVSTIPAGKLMNRAKELSMKEIQDMFGFLPTDWSFYAQAESCFNQILPQASQWNDEQVVNINDAAFLSSSFWNDAEHWSVEVVVKPSDTNYSYYYSDGWTVKTISAVYGKMDSRIGDNTLSVVYSPLESEDTICFSAFYPVNQVSYELRSIGLNQEEFVDLLLSIYRSAALHPGAGFREFLPE